MQTVNYFPKKFHLRCMTGFWIRFCGPSENLVFWYFRSCLLLNWKLNFKQHLRYFINSILPGFLGRGFYLIASYLLSQNIKLAPSPTQIRRSEHFLLRWICYFETIESIAVFTTFESFLVISKHENNKFNVILTKSCL